MLTGGIGFLQGTAFIDANTNGTLDKTDPYLANATIQLFNSGNLVTPISTTTTDSNGAYLFTGLAPGNYVLKEIPPVGYQNSSTQALSQLNPAHSDPTFPTSEIDVTVVDPGSVNVTYNGLIPASSPFDAVHYTLDGGVTDHGTAVSPLSISLMTTAGTTPLFTYCADLLHSVTSGPGSYQVVPEPATSITNLTSTISPATAGEIGYLFNHYGVDQTIPQYEKTALQLAIWSLIYGSSFQVTSVSPGPGSTFDPAQVISQEAAFLTEASTQSEPVTYLDLTPAEKAAASPDNPTGQGVLCTGSLNFGNTPLGTISGTKFDDLTGNGFSPDDTPLGGVTIDLFKSGVSGVFAHTTTGADGTYSFGNLAPGTYTVQEVVPSGWVQTGGGPGANGSYTVAVTSGTNVPSENFDDTEAGCDCNYNIVCETVLGPCGPTQINGLSGHTAQGEVLTVTVSVPAGGCADLSLVSYTAPAASFDANTASQQRVFDSDSIDVTNTSRKAQTYTLTVEIPNSYYQVDLVCGAVIDKFGPANSNIFYHAQDRFIDGDNSGSEKQLTNPASISGEVYVDTNGNGLPTGEPGMGGVTVHLTGTDTFGKKVSLTRITAADGTYHFDGLQPGTYSVSEVQPSGYVTDGINVGTVGGTANAKTNAIDAVILKAGNGGLNYDFGESLACDTVANNTTATNCFWSGYSGQSLIKSFNGSSSSTALGNWLATSFPNLFGANAGKGDLAGKTNSQVASYYQNIYSSSSSSPEVQVLATALDVYATTKSLGGNAGASFGFAVSSGGLGAETINLGSYGSSFGVVNNASVSVLQLLQYVNGQASNGVIDPGNSSLRAFYASSFSYLDTLGD